MPPKKNVLKKNTSNPKKPDNYWQTKKDLEKKNIKLFTQTIFHDWCKACGLCIAFCPKQVFGRDRNGRPTIAKPDDCIGCRFCEMHCPDFAISIQERFTDRRKKPNGR